MTPPIIPILDIEGRTAAELAGRGVAASGGIPAPADPELGDILYYDGTAWTLRRRGFPGQVLTMGDDLLPMWGTLSGGVIVRNILRSPDASAILAPSGDSLITDT